MISSTRLSPRPRAADPGRDHAEPAVPVGVVMCRMPERAHRADPHACPLSAAELRALSLLMDGKTYRQIAERVSRAPSTIRSQLHSAYRRLGVTTSYQAVLVCVQNGWLAWDDEDPDQAAVRRLEAIFERMLVAVQQRVDEEDGELTDRQRDYLRAFEQQLRTVDPHRRIRARRDTAQALAVVLQEAGVSAPVERTWNDLRLRLDIVAERAERVGAPGELGERVA